MSDTPETDYEINYKFFGFYTMGGLPTDAIGVEFARNLERERDAFEQRLFDVRDVLLDAMPDANAPTKILAEMIVAERDELRAGLLTMISTANAVVERWETPAWKDAKPTATFIHALRDVVDKIKGVMP